MNDPAKNLKGLLDHEFDISGIAVSDDLIKRTLIKAEEADVMAKPERRMLSKHMKRIIPAAAILLTAYIGFNLLSFGRGLRMDSSSSMQNKGENSVMMNEINEDDMEMDMNFSTSSGNVDTTGSIADAGRGNDEAAAAEEIRDSSDNNKSSGSLMEEGSQLEDPEADGDILKENVEDNGIYYEDGLYSNAFNSKNLIPDIWGSFVEGISPSSQYEGWIAVQGDEEIVFTLTFRELSIVYERIIDGSGGQFEVYIDGVKSGFLDSALREGEEYVITEEVYVSDTISEHTVAVKRAEDSAGDAFTILGFIVKADNAPASIGNE